jgi:Peptidase S24-like
MSEDRPQTLLFDGFARELIADGCGFRFLAKGRSMLPTIRDGEILEVRPAAAQALCPGDIVLLNSDGEFKVHRIIRRHGDRFTTRGDAGGEADGEVARDSILGLVVAKQAMATNRRVRLHGVGSRLRFWLHERKRRILRLVRGERTTRAPEAEACR